MFLFRNTLFHSDQINEIIDELSHLPTYTIGRKSDNAITITDGKISGQHARIIQCSETNFLLEDLDSKNGTFVNGKRVTRKLVDKSDLILLADSTYTIEQLLELVLQPKSSTDGRTPDGNTIQNEENILDYSREFAKLQIVFEQYPKLRRDCRNREKMIRTGSIILSSVIGVSASLATGGAALPLLHVISGAGLSVLIPTLCSTVLSTDEKLELIDKEYRERYRCPKCRDPFGMREWELLAQQKTCRRCQAIWVN